jgi:hypothetical protein
VVMWLVTLTVSRAERVHKDGMRPRRSRSRSVAQR